jgi:hypothetical protein
VSGKVAVSVSMDVNLAQELRAEVAEGQSFSAHVCELIRAGRSRPSGGLFDKTASDDSVGSPRRGNKQAGREKSRQRRRASRPLMPADHPEPKSTSPPEEGDLSRRSQDSVQDGLPEDDPERSVEERVYSCVGEESRTTSEIAEHLGLSEDDVGAVLEQLIERDDEPIVLKYRDGVWHCWVSPRSAA